MESRKHPSAFRMAVTLLGMLIVAFALMGCQTAPSATDAGCIIWEQNKLKPSRFDTDETILRLYVLNEAMTATCR